MGDITPSTHNAIGQQILKTTMEMPQASIVKQQWKQQSESNEATRSIMNMDYSVRKLKVNNVLGRKIRLSSSSTKHPVTQAEHQQ